jgi:hypothetical protein
MARKNAGIVMSNLRRYLGFWPFLAGVIALFAAPCSAMAEGKGADAQSVVAVVSLKTPQTLAAEQGAIETSVARGLAAAGWKVLGLAETRRLIGDQKNLLECTGELCAIELAHALKTVYLVWAEVSPSKRKYTISLNLFDAAEAEKPMASERGEFAAKDVVPKMAAAAEFTGRRALAILAELAHPDLVPGGQGPVVAVVSAKLPPSVAGDRDGIESGLARGLELAGWQALSVSETMRRTAERKDLRDCASEICTLEVGRLTKARYLVRSSVKIGKGKYTVSLSLLDTENPSNPLAREDEECLDADPDCPPVAEKISHAARMLGRKGIKVVQESGASPGVAATATNPKNPALPPAASDLNVQAPASIIIPPVEEAHSRSRGLRIAGWAALGGGLALLGGSGVFFLYLDGKEHDCRNTATGNRCLQIYDGKPGGYILGGLGLASAAVGTYILLFPAKAHPTTVALTPHGILVGGEF